MEIIDNFLGMLQNNFGIPVSVVLLILGFALLIKGADFFVDGAAGIARKFGIPNLVIGLTIVAMGTSAPEAAVSIAGAVGGNADISIGNVVGSNIMNIFVILGLSAVITPIAVGLSTVKYEIPFLFVISGIFYLLGLDGSISFIDGLVLWGLFIVYLVYLFRMAKNGENDSEEKHKDLSIGLAIVFTILGVVMIILGSKVAVNSASFIAKSFGMTERLIGLTIVAFGTSLPELCTSVVAAYKKNADIAIGNIVGSNVFNILFVIGTSALIVPINFAGEFLKDTMVAIVAVIMVFACVVWKKKLNRIGGAILLLSYLAYFIIFLLPK